MKEEVGLLHLTNEQNDQTMPNFRLTLVYCLDAVRTKGDLNLSIGTFEGSHAMFNLLHSVSSWRETKGSQTSIHLQFEAKEGKITICAVIDLTSSREK